MTTDAGAVAAPRPPALSPSRAGDFKACPLRYRFRVIDRLPEAPSPAAVRGTVVHAVLEQLFDLPAADRTLAAAEGLLPGAWAAVREQEPELAALFSPSAPGAEEAADEGAAERVWLASAVDLLAAYFTLEDPRRLQPAGREEYVEATLADGLLLRGIIDRLDVNGAGEVRVVDYKTGRAPGENWEARALFQLKFYALVLWRSRGIVPRMLQLLYLGDRQRLSYVPQESELLATERQLLALWAAIETATRTGDFRAHKGPLCAFCDHQVRCPAWGGTPPPYPGPAQVPAAAESVAAGTGPAGTGLSGTGPVAPAAGPRPAPAVLGSAPASA